MTELSELFIEENNQGLWDVYFEQPYTGRYVLDSFETEEEAEEFRQDQIDSADLESEEYGDDEEEEYEEDCEEE